MVLRYFLLFLGLSHAAILRSKDLQMDITQLLTLKDLVKTQLVDKKWIDVEKVFDRITPKAGLFENKQTNELIFETKKNSWTQIEIVEKLKVCPNFQNLFEKKNWDEVFLELIKLNDLWNRPIGLTMQQTRLADELHETLADIVNVNVVHAVIASSSRQVRDTHLLEILLKRSETNPDVKNEVGQTPLHTFANLDTCYCPSYYAHEEDDAIIDFVKILLKYGAEIDPTDNNSMTPLMIASKTANVEVVKTLLAHSANPNLRDKHNQTCLHLATSHKHVFFKHAWYTPNVVDLILKHKPEIDATDNEMRTPLMTAAINGHYHVVGTLLRHGANPNLRDKYGKTALHYAAAADEDFIDNWNGSNVVAEILLSAKADPDATDNQMQTPLMIATRKNYNAMASLLNHNANPNLRDRDDKTALDYLDDSIDYWTVGTDMVQCRPGPEAETLMNKARAKWFKKELKQIKRKRQKLLPKQDLEIMRVSED